MTATHAAHTLRHTNHVIPHPVSSTLSRACLFSAPSRRTAVLSALILASSLFMGAQTSSAVDTSTDARVFAVQQVPFRVQSCHSL